MDRVYIEDFLKNNSSEIKGVTLEIAEDTYSKEFGSEIVRYEILHNNNENPNATIVGDLTNISSLPKDDIDCFICTQTLNFIYDFQKAILGIHHILKPKGIVLATVAGLSQISRYDMDRWGDYWRFTDLSIKLAFENVFGKGNVEVNYYGNVFAAKSFLDGLSAEELTKEELFYKDKDYQILITIKATKNA
ncbi:MAG: methyltransferase [Arcobacter sp.]|nr:MAG: methyltransferase [Arcobacter sp.]